MIRTSLLASALLVLTSAARAEEGQSQGSSPPLTAKLVTRTRNYFLPKTNTLSEDLKAAAKTGKYPEPPDVDFVLEIKNVSDRDLQVWVRGDVVLLDLCLKGDGSVEGKPKRFLPREVRLPEAITLAAGKTHELPIKKLRCGLRGVTKQLYWTRAGEYTLSASLHTAYTFGAGGRGGRQASQTRYDDFMPVLLTSNEVKLKIEER